LIRRNWTSKTHAIDLSTDLILLCLFWFIRDFLQDFDFCCFLVDKMNKIFYEKLTRGMNFAAKQQFCSELIEKNLKKQPLPGLFFCFH